MSRSLSSVLLLTALTLLPACTYSTEPVGREPVILESEEWDGVWFGGGMTVFVAVDDEEQGVLRLHWVENDFPEDLNSSHAYLRHHGDWIMANLLIEEESEEPRYLWARLEKFEGHIAIWIPDVTHVEDLIKQGTLQGKSGRYDVTVELTEADLEAIVNGELRSVFNWEAPLLLLRIGK